MVSLPFVEQSPPATAAPALDRRCVPLAALVACIGAVGLHALHILRPVLIWDDFEILSASWTWSLTQANLWVPANEHTMPLGRLSTWLLIQLAGGPTGLPLATALQGPLAVILGMVLVYFFVKRELGYSFYGLVAMALFGITTQYKEAVTWFAASFAILALDTLLLALLAAQRWRHTSAPHQLVICIIWSALAPCWFASGILAGPLCALYLLPWPSGAEEQEAGGARSVLRGWLVRLVAAALPLVGTAAFLADSLPRNAERIMRLEHYGNKTAVESFHVDVGLMYTARSLVDNLLLGSFGISGVNLPLGVVFILLAVMACAALAWWYVAPDRRLLLLGLAFILTSYVLTYSARSEWAYSQVSRFGRYQLFPQLGLVLCFCGGLPCWHDWLLQNWTMPEYRRRSWIMLVLLTSAFEVLFIIQMPRGLGSFYDPQQRKDLQLIEAIDARCRAERIDAATARQALGKFEVTFSSPKVSAWHFLWGSADPLPHSIEEAEQLLAEDAKD